MMGMYYCIDFIASSYIESGGIEMPFGWFLTLMSGAPFLTQFYLMYMWHQEPRATVGRSFVAIHTAILLVYAFPPEPANEELVFPFFLAGALLVLSSIIVGFLALRAYSREIKEFGGSL
ncbi:MAG: hypothetical protein ABL962_15635 [Fimbriimonadaceae bacterium]